MYVTPATLMQRFGALELAQVATLENRPVVSPEVFSRVVLGESTAGDDPTKVADANDALARVQRAITDTDELIDSYIANRYPLPLASVPGILETYAGDIVRYRLHKDFAESGQHPVQVRYRDALRFLGLLAEGKVTLGASDPVSPSGGGERVQYAAPTAVFSREALADY